jgi:NADH-quinone oxidoreductase subunit L
MFLALGVGAYSTAVYHVTTHAFFKALLFLGAGSVIHAMGGEQDIRKMGGLKKALPVTFMTMLLGTIAISGVPPFSGFFSKDEILAHVFEHSPTLWFIGSVTSMLTAFYMFRMMFITFWGSFRGTHEQQHHLHESPKSITIPLIVLAILSVGGGLLGLPEFWGTSNWMAENLDPVILRKNPSIMSHSQEWLLMGIAVAAALATIYFAYQMFIKNRVLPVENEKELKPWQRVVYNKYYVDEFYDAVIRKPLDGISKAFYKFFDIQLIDGIVNGVGTATNWLSGLVRKAQTGHIGFYIMAMVAGIIVILFTTLMK